MADNTDMPWQNALSENIPTIGGLMREAGYYTAYKGKFHMLNEGAIVTPGSDSESSGQDDLEVYGFSDWNYEGEIAGSMLEGYHKDDYIKDSAVMWLRDKGMSLNESGVPFFLAVNFINPHDVMYFRTSEQKTVLETNTAPNNAVYEQSYGYLPPAWEFAPSEKSGISAHREYHKLWSIQTGPLLREEDAVGKFNDYYLNCIQDQDNSMMGLLDELKRLGMMDNTIIIFTSDHGEMAGSHGLKGKGPFIYESNLHVPFIIAHPDYKGGRRIDAVTSHLDITPTILDMTSLPDNKKGRLTEGLAGHSLLPLMGGQVGSVRDGALYVYSMFLTIDTFDPFSATSRPDLTKRGFLRGIVTERYKFARYFSPLDYNTPITLDELYNRNDVELYDLKADPEELRNLAADRATNSVLIEEMNRRLNKLIELEIGVDNGDETIDALKYFNQSPNTSGSGGCNAAGLGVPALWRRW